MSIRPDYATHEDFRKWRDHAKSCNVEALYHIIDDCFTASIAMRTHNTDKEGFYKDQAWTYSDELRDRLNGKTAWLP